MQDQMREICHFSVDSVVCATQWVVLWRNCYGAASNGIYVDVRRICMPPGGSSVLRAVMRIHQGECFGTLDTVRQQHRATEWRVWLPPTYLEFNTVGEAHLL